MSSKTFLVSKGVTHVVNGESLMFYPISIKSAASLRDVGKPLAQAFAALFGGVGQENGQQERVVKTGEDVTHETIILAIDPKLAQIKLETRQKAIETFVNAFTETSTQTTLAKIIMDSLRDVYTAKPPSQQDIDELLTKADVSTLVQLVEGVLLASKDSFGPLASRLSGLLLADSRSAEAESPKEAVTPK